jgi:hypothetical protein
MSRVTDGFRADFNDTTAYQVATLDQKTSKLVIITITLASM